MNQANITAEGCPVTEAELEASLAKLPRVE